MKKFYFLFLLTITVINCRNENEEIIVEEDLMPEKINFFWTNPNGIPNSATDNNYYFTYDNNKRLINKKGGFIQTSSSTGYSVFFNKSINTKIIYENNTATVSNYSDDPVFTISPNTKIYTLTNNQIIEKYIPSFNLYNNKKLIYKYENSKLSEIVTTYPNMPYDVNDPTDYIRTFSEKFEYDNKGNLIKSVLVEKHNDKIYGERTEIIFGNYDNAKNPFKKLYLLDECFYRSLSKNNFRLAQSKTYDMNNNVTFFSESITDFLYDSSGNIILTK